MVFTEFNALGEKSLVPDEEEDIDYEARLFKFFDLHTIDIDVYMSKLLWIPYSVSVVYGGQIISQALNAAFQTVPQDYLVHSLHSYFVFGVSGDFPVIYKVERLRDGRSYITRSVTGTQNGKIVFTCSCSFYKPDSKSYHMEHQTEMPNVISAENTSTIKDFVESTIDKPELPESIREKTTIYRDITTKVFVRDLPVEYRELDYYTIEEVINGPKPSRSDGRWFRSRAEIGDDPRVHALVIALASDFELLPTASKAHGAVYRNATISLMSSLDHSIWFHAQARADEWLLHDMNSPRASEGRGISFGKIYTHDGIFVATTAQEGILRLNRKEQERRKKQAQAESEIKMKYDESSRL